MKMLYNSCCGFSLENCSSILFAVSRVYFLGKREWVSVWDITEKNGQAEGGWGGQYVSRIVVQVKLRYRHSLASHTHRALSTHTPLFSQPRRATIFHSLVIVSVFRLNLFLVRIFFSGLTHFSTFIYSHTNFKHFTIFLLEMDVHLEYMYNCTCKTSQQVSHSENAHLCVWLFEVLKIIYFKWKVCQKITRMQTIWFKLFFIFVHTYCPSQLAEIPSPISFNIR